MEHDHFTIKIDGKEISELYPDLISLEVELDEELADFARLVVRMLQQPDGTWQYLDDPRIRVWKTLSVSAGFESGSEDVFDGYISHLRPDFDKEPMCCQLEIWAMDGTMKLDQGNVPTAWPNKKDSDIARDIFSKVLKDFELDVKDTEVVYDEDAATIIQRESDIQFLKKLAARNGFECGVMGRTAYFGPPKLDGEPQPLLAAHFGDETNLRRFSIEVNAQGPTQVAMAQVDAMSKEPLEQETTQSDQAVLGDTDAAAQLLAGIQAGLLFLGRSAAMGLAEMAVITRGIQNQSEWFVSGEGEIAGNDYGHVLVPRKTVTIKGIGETYSGKYYVTHVDHSFSREGYVQRFKAKRNGLQPDGSEKFSAALEGLLSGIV